MKYVIKGIVKGAFSEFQACGLVEPPVMTFKGESLHDAIHGLALDEWIFVLKVNGKRVKRPLDYIARNGLNLSDYLRNEVAS